MYLVWAIEFISNAGSQGMRWGQDAGGVVCGKKRLEGTKQGRGRRGAGPAESLCHAKESVYMALVFIFHPSQKTGTVLHKPKEDGEHYRVHMFRLCVYVYVYFFRLYFLRAIWGSQQFEGNVQRFPLYPPALTHAYPPPPSTSPIRVVHFL